MPDSETLLMRMILHQPSMKRLAVVANPIGRTVDLTLGAVPIKRGKLGLQGYSARTTAVDAVKPGMGCNDHLRAARQIIDS